MRSLATRSRRAAEVVELPDLAAPGQARAGEMGSGDRRHRAGKLSTKPPSLSAIVRPHAHPTESHPMPGRPPAAGRICPAPRARSVRGRPGVRPRARGNGRAGVRVPRSGARGGLGEGGWIRCRLGPAPAIASRLRTASRRGMKGRSPRRGGRVSRSDRPGGLGGGVPRLLPPAILARRLRPLQVQARAVPCPPQAVTVTVVPPGGLGASRFAAAAREAERSAAAIRWVRDLGNTPGNDLGPVELAAEAKRLAVATASGSRS